jgi:hypothetical protein
VRDSFSKAGQLAYFLLSGIGRIWPIGAIMSDKPTPYGTTDLADVCAMVRSVDSLQIEKCWRAMRGDGIVPFRRSVTARSIPPRLLASMGLCRVRISDEAAEALYRLAGTRYRQMTGAEITGSRYQEFVEGGRLKERVGLLRLAFAIPVGVWWVSEIVFDNEYACLYQSTLLPLRDDESGDMDHLLDLIECNVPMAMQGKRGIMSRKILKHEWIDVGAGTPD